MPIEIRELNITTTVSPREALDRIIKTALSGPAGMNAAIRGVKALVVTETGAQLLKQISQQFTLFNESGTPLRASWSHTNAYPAKWIGPSQKTGGSSSAMFNPYDFTLSKSNSWTEAKARTFVEACLGIRGFDKMHRM